MFEVNLKKLKPYGDRLDDGLLQLSLTLPVKACPEAKEAARLIAEKCGLEKIQVVHMESMGDQFTFFVVYGHTDTSVDFTKITVPKLDFPELAYEELKRLMDRHLENPLVIIGAATGSDAHTVGIDAILNMKGYAGDYGLERYPKFKVYNLRAQLSNAELVRKAVELKADAILVSQVVTQRDSHLKNLLELKDLIKKEKHVSPHLITIIGGPRIDHALALKLGFDAGFGPGTKPSHVASFIVKEYFTRNNISFGLAEKREVEEALPVDEETLEESYPPLSYRQPATGFIKPHREEKVPVAHKPAARAERHAGARPVKPAAALVTPPPAHGHATTATAAPKKKRRRGRRGGRRIRARREKKEGT